MATYWNSAGTAQFSDVDLSGVSYIDALLAIWSATKWGGATGTGTTLTYSIPGNLTGGVSYWDTDYSEENESNSLGYVDATIASAFSQALQAWSDVANINFVQVQDSTTVGDIRLAFYNDLAPEFAAWAYYPGYTASSGDVWLSPSADWSAGALQPGGFGFATLLHELGHALGLSHPEDVGTAPGYDVGATLMSYNEHPHGLFRAVTEDAFSYSWTYEYVQPSTPMLYDIAAIQHLYGANLSYRTGNDTYTFDPATPFFKTIWDAGGIDTISIANFARGSKIDLRAGTYSSIRIPSDPLPDGQTEPYTDIYDGTDNLAIAFGVVIENAVGGTGADIIIGNAVANRLSGLAGADRLLGSGGNDTLNGGTGADTLLGGAGNDLYVVDSTGDRVFETTTASSTADAGGIDTVSAAVAFALGSYVENLTLIGTNAINGTGNALGNKLIGNGAANMLNGGGGNDILNGGAGADTLLGGAGNDVYVVDSTGDRVFETTTTSSSIDAGGIDTVSSAIAYALGRYVENLTLSGTNAINGVGNALANRLTGNGAANVLNGGAGNDRVLGGGGADTLIGGAGKDILTGGAGNDTFRFNAPGETGVASTARDVISDFVRGQDRIDLSALDANTAATGNQAFTQMLAGGTAFTLAAQLKFEGGVLYGNIDADATAEFAIALTGVSTLALTDIIA